MIKKTVFLVLVSFNAFSEDQSIQPLKNTIDYQSNLGHVIFTLIGMIVFILFLAWIIKRTGFINNHHQISSSLKIISSLPLSSKDKVVLIQAGEEQVLIGVSPGNVRYLKSLEKNIDVSQSNGSPVMKFSDSFKSIINGESNKKKRNPDEK